MVELDVKITSGDLYDFLLRHSYNSVSGLLGAVIGALGIIVGISRQYWIYLILGVVILLYLPWTLFIKSKQQVANNPVFREPLHYMLDEFYLPEMGGLSESSVYRTQYHRIYGEEQCNNFPQKSDAG